MPLKRDLLLPISEESPSGENLYYTPLFDEIKEARRQDDAGPQGAWAHDVKTADFPLVFRLTEEALATKTKDIFLAVWLTEALVNLEGVTGLKQGLDLLYGLIDKFWDTVFPVVEEGDAEFRASQLEWLGNYLEPAKGSSPALAVRLLPITADGTSWVRYSESRKVPTEPEAAESEQKAKARKAAIAEKKLPPEEVDASIAATPKAFYAVMNKAIAATNASLKALGTICDDKFADAAPSFGRLRGSLEEVGTTVAIILKKKRELEPDTELDEEPVEGAAGDGDQAGPAPVRGSLTEIKTREDAIEHIVEAAKFLRSSEPLNPAGYLVIRGLRWGELRGSGAEPNPKLLESATTETRIKVRTLALEGKWAEVLTAAEQAAAAPCGRAWLDLHRYAIRACEQLGETYTPVARALKSGLRALLEEYPKLPEMCLMDETPTANLETQAWIRSNKLNPEPLLSPLPGDGNGHGNDAAYAQALESVEAGRAEEGIQSISRLLNQSSYGRARFLRRAELAQLLMAMGKNDIALPILRELSQEVDQRKLEEWESPELVARALALLVRCLNKLGLEPEVQQTLRVRIAHLDITQALSCPE